MQFFTKDQRLALSSGSLPSALQSPPPLERQQVFYSYYPGSKASRIFNVVSLGVVPETGISARSSRHTMFLSIDIEGGVRHGQRLNEVGISILNTASLNPISPETESPILSYNFRLRSRSRYVKHSNPFLFGTTEDIPLDQTKDLFRRIALGGQHPNPFYKSDGVEIVLAGPRVTGDMRIMNRYIPGLWQNAPIAAVIDLHVLHGGIRLAKALDGLNIEKGQYRGLHCGGNDANYCLRAPLLTAVKHFESDIGGALIDQERAGKIRAVALGTAPSLTSELDQKGKKWYNAGDIEESLDVLGIGWSNLIFDQERKDFL